CSQEPCPRRVGGRTIARLGPGGVSTAATSFRIPADLPSGVYVVYVTVDGDQRVPESNEANNTRTSAVVAVIPDVRGTRPVSATGTLDACTDPSLGGPFELPSGSLVIASQTRDRFTGTATFVAPSLGLTRRFVFRLSGTVDTASATRGSYLVSVTGGLPGALTGDGGFEGRVTGGVDLRLDGQLRNPGDQCHMTVNVVGTPAAAAHASVPQGQLGDSTLGTLPR